MAKRKGEFFDENDLDSNELNIHSFRISWMIKNYDSSVSKIVIESPKFSSSPNASTQQWFLEFVPKPISAESTESFEITLKKTIPGDDYVKASLFSHKITRKYNFEGQKKILPLGKFIFWKANINQLSKILKWDETYQITLKIKCDVTTLNICIIKNPRIKKLETGIMSDIYNLLNK